MEQEVKKPFKTVTTEYFEELDTENPAVGQCANKLKQPYQFISPDWRWL